MWQWLSNNWPNILQIGVFVIAIGGGVIGRVFNEVRKQRILREQQQRLAREREAALRTGRSDTEIPTPAGTPRPAQAPAMALQGAMLAPAGTSGSALGSPASDSAAAARNAELARRRQEAAERFREQLERRRAQQQAGAGQSSRQPSGSSATPSAGPSGDRPTTTIRTDASRPDSQRAPEPIKPGDNLYAKTSIANNQSQLDVLIERRKTALAAPSPMSKHSGDVGSKAIRTLVGNKRALRQAIVLSEVLGPPKSTANEQGTTSSR